MADIHIQQGEGFFDLVIQVTPTAEGAADRIVMTTPGPHAKSPGERQTAHIIRHEPEREAGG